MTVGKIIPFNDRDQQKAAVIEGIEIGALLRAYGIAFRRGGGRNQLCSRDCPTDRHSDNDAFRFDEVKKLWQCFKCNTKGDVFHWIAAMEGVDCGREFPAVLARAAEIADVDLQAMKSAEWAAKNEERQRERERRYQDQMELERRAAGDASARAAANWGSLFLHHEEGVAYLASRGIVRIPRFVRFDRRDAAFADSFSADGSPAIAVRDLDKGEICGIVRRRIPPFTFRPGTKAPTLTGTRGNGTLAGAIADIGAGQDAIVLEGIVDTITASVLWPDAVVLGANGTGPMNTVIVHAAKRVRRLRGRLFVVSHADAKQQGQKAVAKGMRIACGLGLRPGNDLRIVELDGAKDLNDAHRAGWRPS